MDSEQQSTPRLPTRNLVIHLDASSIDPTVSTSRDLQRFDRIRATFTPRRRDDLRDVGSVEAIGHRRIWRAAWIIDEGDYVGEWAMFDENPEARPAIWWWVPLGDLSDIEYL